MMGGRVAVIILSRNLPDVVERQVRLLQEHDCGRAEFFVVESGTDQSLLSSCYTSWANWPDAMKDGLRLPQGFNFGLLELINNGRFEEFEYFLLMRVNIDVDPSVVEVLVNEIESDSRIGIVSPCGVDWEERGLIGDDSTRFVWHTNHYIWLLRRQLIEKLMERESPNPVNFLYDGTNFRGYMADTELVVKGYVNEYATALTTRTWFREDDSTLRTRADLIKTDPYHVNQRRVFEEAQRWMKRKYGFTSRLQMYEYANLFYDRFFDLHPDLADRRFP
jgi:hypothetical protein